jgi:hypothetical protein
MSNALCTTLRSPSLNQDWIDKNNEIAYARSKDVYYEMDPASGRYVQKVREVVDETQTEEEEEEEYHQPMSDLRIEEANRTWPPSIESDEDDTWMPATTEREKDLDRMMSQDRERQRSLESSDDEDEDFV